MIPMQITGANIESRDLDQRDQVEVLELLQYQTLFAAFMLTESIESFSCQVLSLEPPSKK